MPTLDPIYNATPEKVVSAQKQAREVAQRHASSITGVNGSDQALVREILPDADLASGPDNNWTDTERDWVQGGLAANAEQDTYSIDSNGEAQDKVLVFYGVYNVAADPLTTEVAFEDGTGATFARMNVEAMELAEVSPYVIFSQPIVYGSTEDGTLVQWADDTGDDQLVFMAKVAEPIGNTLSTRESDASRLGGNR